MLVDQLQITQEAIINNYHESGRIVRKCTHSPNSPHGLPFFPYVAMTAWWGEGHTIP